MNETPKNTAIVSQKKNSENFSVFRQKQSLNGLKKLTGLSMNSFLLKSVSDGKSS